MTSGGEKKLLAADYFQRAIRMQPDVVEWQTSHVLGLVNTSKHSKTGVEEDIMEKLREAKEQDPENLYLAAVYLLQLAKNGQTDQSGARELATKVLRNPVSSYSGIKPLLRFYRTLPSMDEGVALAEEALKLHPDERYLKRCAALTYKWKIWEGGQSLKSQPDRERDPCPWGADFSLSSFFIYEENRPRRYLRKVREPPGRIWGDLEAAARRGSGTCWTTSLVQPLRKISVTSLNEQYKMSIQYHMKAAQIPIKSFSQENSIQALEKIRHKKNNQEVDEFLSRLKESQK